MTQMNYAQAIEYMQELATESGKEIEPPWIDVQEKSNAPQVVSVAGSKGKSSILTYLDAIYAYMKVKVCICHLRFYQNVEDCILMNGKSIPKARLAEYVSRLQEQTQDKRITFARAIQIVAYWYACDKECKILYVESDAKQEAIELSEITGIKSGVRKQSFSYHGYQKLEIGMKGTFQIENAARAVEFVERLAQNQEYAGKSPVVRENAIRKGLAEAVWEGSLYQAGTKPLCIQDMADDAESVEVLISHLKKEQAEKPWILLMAMEKENNWRSYAKDLCESAMMTITVTPSYMNRREVYSAYELAQELSAYTDRITAADSIEEALELGGMLAGGEGILVCFGTHTVPGEVSRILAMKMHRVSDTHGI